MRQTLYYLTLSPLFMKKQIKPVKAWAVVFDGRIDLDKMSWFNAVAYTVFPTKADAVKWIGYDRLPEDTNIIPVLLSPLTIKKK